MFSLSSPEVLPNSDEQVLETCTSEEEVLRQDVSAKQVLAEQAPNPTCPRSLSFASNSPHGRTSSSCEGKKPELKEHIDSIERKKEALPSKLPDLLPLIEKLEQKKLALLGFGLEGKSSLALILRLAKTYKKYPSSITVYDQQKQDLSAFLTEEKLQCICPLYMNTHEHYLEEALEKNDYVWKSPGISLLPYLKTKLFSDEHGQENLSILLRESSIWKSLEKKLLIQNDVFLQHFSSCSLGVTGSKGKSTTTTLAHHLLQAQLSPHEAIETQASFLNPSKVSKQEQEARQVHLMGNIGVPVLEVWDPKSTYFHQKGNLYCLELGVHQLEYMLHSPHVAMMTNFYPEHLDHYISEEAYYEAKMQLVLHQKEEDYFFYVNDKSHLAQYVQKYQSLGRLQAEIHNLASWQECFPNEQASLKNLAGFLEKRAEKENESTQERQEERSEENNVWVSPLPLVLVAKPAAKEVHLYFNFFAKEVEKSSYLKALKKVLERGIEDFQDEHNAQAKQKTPQEQEEQGNLKHLHPSLQKGQVGEYTFYRLTLEELPFALQGMHHAQDIALAFLGAFALYLKGTENLEEMHVWSWKKMQACVQNFQGLPHRLEDCGFYRNRQAFNDSISTIPQSTCLALQTLGTCEVLILGGMDRGLSYTSLLEFLQGYSSLTLLIGLPETGHQIVETFWKEQKNGLQKANILAFKAHSMQEAVDLAMNYSKNQDKILLSPAASSYNRYKNFAARGQDFKLCLSRYKNEVEKERKVL